MGPVAIDSEHEVPTRRFGPIFGALWLIYLVYPIGSILERPSIAERVLGVALVIAFGALFIGALWRFRGEMRTERPLPARFAWAALLAMGAIACVLAVMLGTDAFGTTIYIAVLAVMALPTPHSAALVAVMVVAVEVSPYLVDGWEPDRFFGFQLLVSAAAAWAITRVFKRNHELADAKAELAALAVIAERERMGRDVHDILGHSLTVITVKAELAGRLIDLDPARAAREIGEVEMLAREALNDVRSTVGGTRAVDVATELGTARAALTTAGIVADFPPDADMVPLRNRELFGWVLREAVTNVIRHSGAERCSVSLSSNHIRIDDDGRGPGAEPSGTGSGLRGLGNRVHAAGGSLTVGRSAAGGFDVEVRTG